MWFFGCITVSLSIALHAVASHKEGITDKERSSLHDAANLSIAHGIGMCMLSFAGGSYLIFLGLVCGVLLFTGLLTYGILTGDKSFQRFVPTGGMIGIITWILMAIFCYPKSY